LSSFPLVLEGKKLLLKQHAQGLSEIRLQEF
jgi:hypothetical protein